MTNDDLRHVYEIFIAADPEQIWQALTTTEFTRRYFHATAVSADWTVGAAVVFTGPNGRPVVEGEVLSVDRPRRLSYTWHVLYDDALRREPPSRVSFLIEPLGDVSKLTVIHEDFAPDSQVYAHVSQGWSAILCSLKTLLETGKPLPIAGNE